MLVEQDAVTDTLLDEHTGFVEVAIKDTLRNQYQDQQPPSPPSPSHL